MGIFRYIKFSRTEEQGLYSNRDLEFTDGASGSGAETPGGHRANQGVEDMILMQEVCMAVVGNEA